MDMRIVLATITGLAILTSCDAKTDRDSGEAGRDTTITSERVQDTTIVTADTSIDVDTVSTTDNIKRAKE